MDQQVRRLQPGPRPIDLRDGGARGLILTVSLIRFGGQVNYAV
jgi:hypothetical protein